METNPGSMRCGAFKGKHYQIKCMDNFFYYFVITYELSYLPRLTRITDLFSLMWVVMVELIMVAFSEIQR
jgi:hypothetical protein